MKSRLMGGMDLHSNNLVIALVTKEGKRLISKKVECSLAEVLEFLKPYQKSIDTLAVESTFNWYWLVDGLRANGYNTVLANPAKMDQYGGIKHADDENDAYFIAELLRLKILPTGYIYDPKLRPVRDILRRRMSLVQHRTALMLSFKSLFTRTTGEQMSLGQLKGMEVEQARKLYDHPANQLIAGLQIKHVGQLTESILSIEKEVLKSAKGMACYEQLKSLPGVGIILGLVITMETGEVKRFASDGDFASYCRLVDSKRMSNGKKKGDNNQKCGNKYLAWAFVEAANFSKRYDEDCRRWFDRKAAKTKNVIATKALACKLAKAAWFIMAEKADYDRKRMFPELASQPRTKASTEKKK